MSKTTKYTFEDVERTLTFHRDRLLSYQNVLHLSIGEKVKNGCGKKRLAIRVYVSKKEKESTIKFVPYSGPCNPDNSLSYALSKNEK